LTEKWQKNTRRISKNGFTAWTFAFPPMEGNKGGAVLKLIETGFSLPFGVVVGVGMVKF